MKKIVKLRNFKIIFENFFGKIKKIIKTFHAKLVKKLFEI